MTDSDPDNGSIDDGGGNSPAVDGGKGGAPGWIDDPDDPVDDGADVDGSVDHGDDDVAISVAFGGVGRHRRGAGIRRAVRRSRSL